MTCLDVNRRLAGGEPPTEAALAHADTCSSCRALLALDESLSSRGDSLAPGMSAELRAALSELPAASPFSPWARAAVPATALLVLLGLVAAFAPRPDLARAPWWLAIVLAIGFLGSFASGLGFLLVRDHSGNAAGRAARVGFLVVAAAAYATLSVLQATAIAGPAPARSFQGWLGQHVVPSAGEWVRHLPCSLLGLLAGGVVVAAIAYAVRRTVLAAPALAGAVSGAAAAMGTAFVLFAFCSSHSLWHVTAVHAAPLLALVGFGALLGRRHLAV